MFNLGINKALVVLGSMLALAFSIGAVPIDAVPTEGSKPADAAVSKIGAQQLGGDERYLIYASVDKPVYREREPLFLRAVFLNSADNTPVKNGNVNINVKIRGPKGNFVFESNGNGDDSVAGIRWDIPEGTPGGQYTALVSSYYPGAPQAERTFEIRAYRAPRLKTQIEFARDGYGIGDLVQASIQIDRAEGGVPEGAKVTVIARVDGERVFYKSDYRIPADGILSTEFELPKFMEIGDGNIAFVIEDGGVVETASKTLPILLQTMNIDFYAEGGDLIANLPNRVYVQVKRPDGKPADIAGRIVELVNDKRGNELVAKLETQHEGRGLFMMTPMPGKRYALVVDQPAGFTQHFYLPKSKSIGTVLQSTKPVFSHNEAIEIKVTSIGGHPATRVTLHKREVLIDEQEVSDDERVSLEGADGEGVLIVTAWNAAGTPLAERLIYRKPKFAVNVELSVGEGPFIPGGEVSLDILTTDENGKPVEAVVGVTVTDDTVLEMIDKREQAPRLPVMVYLENEVEDLADAQVYLDTDNSDAPQALDLLLGTQGWRRFILVNYDQIKASHSVPGMRAMAENIADQVALEETAEFAVRRVQNEIVLNAPALVAPAAPEFAEVAAPMEEDALFEIKDDVAQMAGDIGFAREKRAIMMTVREYAFQVRPNRKANDRVDFTETLYWNKGVRTSARDGKATVKFGLSDSVTTFRVIGDAFGRNGALGNGDAGISSVEPFYIEPKLPLQITAGDVVELPVSLVNATDSAIDIANLLVKGEGLTITQVQSIKLEAGERVRQVVRIIADRPGDYALTLSAAAGPYSDRVTRNLSVKAKGFPISVSHGGLIGPETGFNTEVMISASVQPGSLNATAKVYPSPLANMEEALNALLREPNGCFEQTSSSNYPLVMAQQYFMSHQGVAPEKISKAKSLLNKGYKKLIGFESQGLGYEWFGANPAHEALTAYGLMEFVDMAKVMPVDTAMIERTRKWLLGRRDGQGGFKRNELALDSFGRAPAPTTNAYIVWSLLESGEDPATLRKEIEAVKAQALAGDDSYIIALAANILFLADDKNAANEMATKLTKAVDKDGAVSGALTSITQSGGDALTIEATSLALLAWLKDDRRWAAQVENSMKWLFERSKSGRFGSTQSTILALKAINAYDAARAKPKKPGTVQLLVDGKPFGKPVTFDADTKGAIELPDFSAALSVGEHALALRMDDGSDMPFAVEVTYNTDLPASNDASELTLKTQLSDTTVKEGEVLEITATIKASDKVAPTPIAIIGIPAGLEVRHDQLKELIGSNRISSYEVIGREVVLYWRALKASEERVIPISLTAAVPGTYVAPASRTYLYYTDENKHWTAGQQVTVEPISR